jgi:Putative MetA-pathway of phenol degradation
MSRRIIISLSLFCGLVPVRLSGQANPPCNTANNNIACTIPQVAGVGGIQTVSGPGYPSTTPHSGAHFEQDFEQALAPLNSGVASQLALLPLAAPASGIALSLGKSGVAVASNESFGPILSERAKTLGRHRIFLGFSYQYFHFDRLDGVDLNHIPIVEKHLSPSTGNAFNAAANCSLDPSGPNQKGCAFIRDRIETMNQIDLTLNQYTAYVAFGLTKRIDVSAAIPIIDVRMNATTTANIIDQSGSFAHEFAASSSCPSQSVSADGGCLQQIFNPGQRTSSGIGDVTFRIKGTIWQGEHSGIAAGLDVRTPTGDALNFQGAGAVAVRPFVVWSYAHRFSPHINAGYEWNGDSILAGDFTLGTKGHLPNQFLYSAGVDAGVTRRLTLSFDLIGQVVLNGTQTTIQNQSFLGKCNTPYSATGCVTPAPDPNDIRPTLVNSSPGNYTITSAAAGLRLNPWKNLLISGNALFKLDDGGLRATIVPLISVSYTFGK